MLWGGEGSRGGGCKEKKRVGHDFANRERTTKVFPAKGKKRKENKARGGQHLSSPSKNKKQKWGDREGKVQGRSREAGRKAKSGEA